jgi:hypothetical protein
MKLLAQSGPHTGTEFPVNSDIIIVGRGAGSDIQLDDPQVSRQHAEIRSSGLQVSIADAGSRNGTFVNGARIQGMQVLQPGDEIRIGDTRLVLQEGMAMAAAWAAPSQVVAAPQPVAHKSKLGLMVGGVLLLILLAVGGVAAFLLTRRGGSQVVGGVSTPTVQPVQATPAAQPTAIATPGALASAGPTATSLVQLFVTFTPRPGAPTETPAPGGAPSRAASTPQTPPFTVVWSPGRYEGWADGRRMSSDLAIENVNLPEINPPYTPYFVISDPKGKFRQADLQDYGGGKGPPVIAKGQKIVWTWFGVMSEQEWVRGSVLRYGGYAWAQEFNPDGSLNGPPRVIDEKQLMPFLPKEVSPELLPTLAAAYAATIAAGGLPTGVPTGIPTGAPKP